MNNSRIHPDQLFSITGCLTAGVLTQLVKGTLKSDELVKVQQHIAECPLCADAAEGLRLLLRDNAAQPLTNESLPESNFLLQTKTEQLNERITARVQNKLQVHPDKYGHNNYRRYAWIAAAAAVLLFMSGFYVLWVRNQLQNRQMAQKLERDSLFQTYTYDTLPQPPPASETVLAVIKDVNIKGKPLPPVVSIVSKDDARVVAVNSAPSGSSDESDVQALKQASGSGGAWEESGVSEDYRNYTSATARHSGGATKRSETEDESKIVLSIADEMPSFPGGDSQRLKFLKKHIRYPGQASENDIQGTVFVSFVVRKNGNLADIKILKGIGGGCDQEAMRVVKLMPRWNPGYQNGRKTDVRFTMPVYFKLQQ